MRAARVITLAVATVIAAISSQALAERTVRGAVVKVDGMAGIISVREMHPGMAGAISYGMAEEFKVQDGLLYFQGLLYVPEGAARLQVLQNRHDS